MGKRFAKVGAWACRMLGETACGCNTAMRCWLWMSLPAPVILVRSRLAVSTDIPAILPSVSLVVLP
jgi:hypothetical protein